ncbi:hypothetical protein BKA67DRAFT_539981 [Truncatella angustata]|uniref:Uncharacterized protein n=1 Tax=Truncatella angustata TaxID=152316 RepID=A0A9P8ZS72_9PEZI|nr:uncharacterized protein BKA67DRAFT_539981 [Truncatella angustata]KAH6648165.1 hypothetical protein BKA67DRAFT_539981 [Truncatella angustata]KAH8201410.1 hypothetical protein TruAng_004410 [Truncatella angustata]
MAAASVMIPISSISQNGGTLPPSALVQHSPRHGRSRAASMKKGNRYNVMENRDNAITKAVQFVLKRTVSQSELDEESENDEEDERLVSAEDGWVMLPDLLQHSRITDLRVTLADLQRITSNTSKARCELRQQPGSEAETPESYQIRGTHKRDSLQAPVIEGEPLKLDAEDLPEYIVYETSYEAYPHILASGSIEKAAGATHISFSPVATDGSETRRAGNADIGIWVHLRTALETEPSIVWQKTANGAIATTNEIPKSLWKKAVARRSDIGLLFEDGEVRGEVPEALRGKGSKGKAKKGKGSFKSRGGEEASDSASDE